MNEKIKEAGETLTRNEMNVKAVETNVAEKVKLVQEQLNEQEETNRQLKADNLEIKKSLNKIMKQLERMTQQTSHEVQAEEMKKEIAEGDGMEKEQKVVVAGGAEWSAIIEFCGNVQSGIWNLDTTTTNERTAQWSIFSYLQLSATCPWRLELQIHGKIITECCSG